MTQKNEMMKLDEKYNMIIGDHKPQYASASQPSLAQPSVYKDLPSYAWSGSKIPERYQPEEKY